MCVTKQAVSWKLHSAEAIEWGAEYRRINEMKQCRPLSVWLLKPLAGCCLADVTSSHWSLALPLYRSVAFTLCRNVSLNKLSHAHRLSSQDVILCWEDVWNASHSLTATSPISFQTQSLSVYCWEWVEECSLVLQSSVWLFVVVALFLFSFSFFIKCVSVPAHNCESVAERGNTWAVLTQRFYGGADLQHGYSHYSACTSKPIPSVFLSEHLPLYLLSLPF